MQAYRIIREDLDTGERGAYGVTYTRREAAEERADEYALQERELGIRSCITVESMGIEPDGVPGWFARHPRISMVLALIVALLALNATNANADTSCGGTVAEDGSCIGDPATYYGEPVQVGSYTAIAETVQGRGLGYGPAYWSAVGFYVGVDNDTYAAAYENAPPAVQNVMYRAAYDSVTGTLYEDFSTDGTLVKPMQPVHVWHGPAPEFQ